MGVSIIFWLFLWFGSFLFLVSSARSNARGPPLTRSSSSLDDKNKMMLLENSKWILTKYPADGCPFRVEEHAKFIQEEISLENMQDQIVLKVEILGLDAFLRTLLFSTPNNVHGNIKLGNSLPAMGIARVLQSPLGCKYKPGDVVCGFFGGQTYCCIPTNQSYLIHNKIINSGDDTTTAGELSHLGPSGLAAYLGMYETPLGKPKVGDTVLVSAAAGATGSLAVQYAQLCGAKRVVGMTRRGSKLAFLKDTLKVDATIDYTSEDLETQFDKACPDGIDVYFDNVGGPLLDKVLDRLNPHGRVIICGAISQYNHNKSDSLGGEEKKTPLHILLAEKSATMTGFNLFHFSTEKKQRAKREIQKLVDSKKITVYNHVLQGIENFGPALEMLFEGGNTGKLLVQVT